jgi:hypothetical protein
LGLGRFYKPPPLVGKLPKIQRGLPVTNRLATDVATEWVKEAAEEGLVDHAQRRTPESQTSLFSVLRAHNNS